MKRNLLGICGIALVMIFLGQPAIAGPVDLELVLAVDVSGSIDSTDFALQRDGLVAAFRDADVISAIEDGHYGSIAVTLVYFANNVSVAVPWTMIGGSVSSNSFADSIAAATQTLGGNDGQSNLINNSLASLISNGFTGTRSVLDIVSEGAQDIDGCSFNNVNCTTVQTARDAFLLGGGTAINAIWLNDRDFFGLDASDIINAFEYGSTNVIGGPGSFQTFAYDFTYFAPAIEAKLIREITPVPEPGSTLLFLSIGFGAIGLMARRWR